MRFSTAVLAGFLAALSVQAQEGSMTTQAIEDPASTTLEASEGASIISGESSVATSTTVLVVDTTTSVPPAVSGTQSASPAEVSRAACLDDCGTDNDCRAACATIADAVNPIGDCQRKCVKGNGTAEEDLLYKNCFQDCILTASVSSAVATTTTTSGEATETEDVTATTDAASTTRAGAGSGTSSAATTSSTGAAANMQAGFSAAGIMGVAAFMLAL